MPVRFSILFSFFLLLASACSSESTLSPGSVPVSGEMVFVKNCVVCHGRQGNLQANGAKDLTKSNLTLESRIGIITHGKNLMTPFGATLKPEEIQAVARYTLSLKQP